MLSTALNRTVSVSMEEGLLSRIDQARDDFPRSRFIAKLLLKALSDADLNKKEKAGGGPPASGGSPTPGATEETAT